MRRALLAALLLPVICYGAEAEDDDFDASLITVEPTYDLGELARAFSYARVRADAEVLASLGTRVTGTAGNLSAREYLRRRLASAGVQRIDAEEFDVLAPLPDDETMPAALELPDGQQIRLEPLWPNLVRPSLAPRAGITGPLVYAGDGQLSAYDNRPVEGCIAVLEFNSGRAWYDAAMVGASAVVFLGDRQAVRGEAEQKFSELTLSTPRFLALGPAAAALRAATAEGATPDATVRGGARWRTVRGANLYGFIPGTDPSLSAEPVVLTAYYDSMSVAPTYAPGAEAAFNCAFLLELARILNSYPPARPVIILLTDAHGLAMAGMRDFVQRRVTKWRDEKPKAAESRELEDLHFRGMIGVDLTSHGSAVGAFYKGFFYNFRDDPFKFSDFATACRDYGWLIARELGIGREWSLIDCISTGTDRSWASYLPARICLEAECATLAGYAGTSLCTTGDARPYVDTYSDTLDRIDHANLERQMRVVACAVPNLLSERTKLSDTGLYGGEPEDGFARVHGGVYEFGKSISFLPQDPVPGAIACWVRITKTLCGVRHTFMDQVGDDGAFELVGMPMQSLNWGAAVELAGFLLDDDTGEVIYAPDRGAQGAKRLTFDNFVIEALETGKDIVLFESRQLSVFDTIDQGWFGVLSDVAILDQATKALPFKYGFLRPSWTDPRIPGDHEPAAVIYGQPGAKLLLLFRAGFSLPRAMCLNGGPDHPLGDGIAVDEVRVVSNLPYRSAWDLWWLNETRMNHFEQFGIGDPRAKRLHEDAAKVISAAGEAQAAGRIAEYVALSRRALALENRVYPHVEGTGRDVVHGVIFYLVLLLPFAYLTERLLLAGRTIKSQVAGAAGIFLCIFVLLALVHPAFRITTTPLIVLLAFVLMMLAVLVGVLIFRHFDQQMAEYRHKTIGQHEADVARLSSATAAFVLGVGNMRRRKTRTGLTCATLVLLTFTVISFTSVRSEQRIRKIRRDTAPAYSGVLLRTPTYGAFSEYTYTAIANEFGRRFPVVPRAWVLSEGSALRSSMPIRRGDTLYDAGALLGVSHAEAKVTRLAETLVGAGSRWFGDGPEDLATCILPTRIAAGLGVTESDIGTATVEIRGMPLTVIGLYDGDAADDLRDLDGEMMTPIDEIAQANLRRQGKQGPEASKPDETGTTTANTPHITAGAVVLVRYDMALRLGGALRSIAANLGDEKEAARAQDDLVGRLDLGVFAGFEGATHYCSAVGAAAVSGFEGTLIPVLIAALIVLNTMLGSVYERVREIGIFSSVGLAPAHVGFLFLAEAAVYAVIGAIVGYLIGQAVAWLYVNLGWFSGLLSLNYSSLAAVGTTLIVMAVVFLSTIYPARKAADLAVAGIERRWRLPEPDGDELSVDLPFTMQEEECLGLLAYIAEYLDAHSDYSVGEFSTDGASFARLERKEPGDPWFALRFHAWLSPYDLGVSEEVELLVVPTEEEGVLGARARVYRVSGDAGAWLRCTRSFLHLIRRQFLLWRAFAPSEKVRYHQAGEEVAARGAAGAAW